MSWTTVVLIGIGAVVLIFVIWAVVAVAFAWAGLRWSEKMDREHEEFRRRHGFPRR